MSFPPLTESARRSLLPHKKPSPTHACKPTLPAFEMLISLWSLCLRTERCLGCLQGLLGATWLSARPHNGVNETYTLCTRPQLLVKTQKLCCVSTGLRGEGFKKKSHDLLSRRQEKMCMAEHHSGAFPIGHHLKRQVKPAC
uniref:Uncharacterized protein n=1 Tax=Fundulus heteroclitus TaxID=8078 RepID=A0A146TFP5_FUNHE